VNSSSRIWTPDESGGTAEAAVAAVTEPSSLQCLTMLDQSTAVVFPAPEKIEDGAKLITGKYLNQLLAVFVDFAEQNQEDVNIVSVLQLELKLKQRMKNKQVKRHLIYSN
jgi:hypothetical protein